MSDSIFEQYKFKQGGRGDTGLKGIDGDSCEISVYGNDDSFGLLSKTGNSIKIIPPLSSINIENKDGDTLSYNITSKKFELIEPTNATTINQGQVYTSTTNDIENLNDSKIITPKLLTETITKNTQTEIANSLIFNRRNRRGDINSYIDNESQLDLLNPTENGYTVLSKLENSISVWNNGAWTTTEIENLENLDEFYILQSIDNALIYLDNEWILSGTVFKQGTGNGSYVSPYVLGLQDKIIRQVNANWDNNNIEYTEHTLDWTINNIPHNGEFVEYVLKKDSDIIHNPRSLSQAQLDSYLSSGYDVYSLFIKDETILPEFLNDTWILDSLSTAFVGDTSQVQYVRPINPVLTTKNRLDYRLTEYTWYWNDGAKAYYNSLETLAEVIVDGNYTIPINPALANGKYTLQMLADIMGETLPELDLNSTYTLAEKPVEYVPAGNVENFNEYICKLSTSEINYTLVDTNENIIPVNSITLSNFSSANSDNDSLKFKYSINNNVIFSLVENLNTFDLGQATFRVTFQFTLNGKEFTHSELIDLIVFRDSRLEKFDGTKNLIKLGVYTAYRANSDGMLIYEITKDGDNLGNSLLLGASFAGLKTMVDMTVRYDGEWWDLWGLIPTSLSISKRGVIPIKKGTVFKMNGWGGDYYYFQPDTNMGLGSVTAVYS